MSSMAFANSDCICGHEHHLILVIKFTNFKQTKWREGRGRGMGREGDMKRKRYEEKEEREKRVGC